MAGLAVQMGLGNMGAGAVWEAGVEWVGMEVVVMKVEGVVEVQESARVVRNHSGKALVPLHSCTAPSAVSSSPEEGMLPFSRSDKQCSPALHFRRSVPETATLHLDSARFSPLTMETAIFVKSHLKQ
jgi:hypothetical protein